MLILVLLSSFADHLTNATFTNYLQFLFTSHKCPLIANILIAAGLSFFISCLLQSFVLRRFGKVWIREIIILNLILNSLCILAMSLIHESYAWLLVIFRLLTNLMTSEIYCTYAIQQKYSDERQRNNYSAVLILFISLAAVISVVFPLAGMEARLAMPLVCSFSIIMALIVFFAFDKNDIYQGKKVDNDVDKDCNCSLDTNSTTEITTDDSDIITTDVKSNKATDTNSIDKMKDPNPSLTISASNSTVGCIQVITDCEWLLTAATIFFRNVMNGIVYANAFLLIKSTFDLGIKQVSLVSLTLNVSSVFFGSALSYGLRSAWLSKVSNGKKLGLVLIIQASMICFFHKTLGSLYGSVILSSAYAVLDFTASPFAFVKISGYTDRLSEKMMTIVLTGTLSLTYLGGSLGTFLSKLECIEIEYAANAIVICVGLLLFISNKG